MTKEKMSLVWSCVAVLAFLCWTGSTVYSRYTELEIEVAKAQARAKETAAMFDTIRAVGLAAAETNNEALAQAQALLARKARGE